MTTSGSDSGAFALGGRRQVAAGAIFVLVTVAIGITILGLLAERPHTHLHFAVGWLGVATVGFVLAELLHAELWRRVVIQLGARLGARRAYAIWCVSAVARYVPTSMLMPVLRVSMSKAQKVPPSACMASLLYEGALATSAALFVGAYFIAGLEPLRGEAWRWGVFLIPVMTMLALEPRVAGWLSGKVLRRLGREPLPAHLSTRQLLQFGVGYVMSFLLAGGGLLAVILACHPLSLQNVPVVLGAYAVGFAAALVAFILPGGIGAREIALVGVLSAVVPILVATAASVAVRLIQIVTELLLALIASWAATRE